MFRSFRRPTLSSFAATGDLDRLSRRRELDWGGDWSWSFIPDPPLDLPQLGILPAEAPIEHAISELVSPYLGFYPGSPSSSIEMRVGGEQWAFAVDDEAVNISFRLADISIDGWLEPPSCPSQPHLGAGLYASVINPISDRWLIREALEVVRSKDGIRSTSIGVGIRDRVEFNPARSTSFDEIAAIRLVNSDLGFWGRFEDTVRITVDSTAHSLTCGLQGEYEKETRTINSRADLSANIHHKNFRCGAFVAVDVIDRANGFCSSEVRFGGKSEVIHQFENGLKARMLVHGSNSDSGAKAEVHTGMLIFSGALKYDHQFKQSSVSFGVSLIE